MIAEAVDDSLAPALPEVAATIPPSSSHDLDGVRVVCFYPWVPFEPSGSWTRFSSYWKTLLRHGADVTLAFLCPGNDSEISRLKIRYQGETTVFANRAILEGLLLSAKSTAEFKQYTPAEVDLLFRYEPSLYLKSRGMAEWLDTLVREADIVTLEYPMYAGLLSPICKKWNRRLVITSHDCLFELKGTGKEAKALLRAKEIESLKTADAVFFVNDGEEALFAQFDIRGITTPNSADALRIKPGDEARARRVIAERLRLKQEHFCLFVGSSHEPNAEAAEEMKKLARDVPEMTFVVAGACHPKFSTGNFHALGQVSADMLDLLYRAARFVLIPLKRGTGMSVKTFDAFAYQKPVITTPVGLRGYHVTPGVEAEVVANATEMAAAIRRLHADLTTSMALAARARELALSMDCRRAYYPYVTTLLRLLGRAPSHEAAAASAIFLMDPNLKDHVGHHFHYAQSIQASARELGIPFHTLVHREVSPEVIEELGGAAGTFTAYDPLSQRLNPYPAEWGTARSTYEFLRANDLFAEELWPVLRSRCQPDDHIFIPNATPLQILGLATLLHNKPAVTAFQFTLVLRYTTFRIFGPITQRKAQPDPETAERYAFSLGRLRAADRFGCITLATDSSGLAAEFAQFWDRPIQVLPVPHTQLPRTTRDIDALPVPPKVAGRARVVFLGDARDEKGFELLPAVVKAFSAPQRIKGVEFVFQAYVSSRYHAAMNRPIEELSSAHPTNLTLLRSSLSQETYDAVLESADLVLLPYDALTYASRTSGPFVEAICAGKPVIVPRNSWMSQQLGGSQAGLTFVSGNADDLIRTLAAALQNLPQLQQAATEFGQAYRDFHNATNFCRSLAS